MLFTDRYAQPSCTAGRAAFITGQLPVRTGMSKVEALDMPRVATPDVLPPSGTLDPGSVATATEQGAVREIKEWQAIMDYLRSLPVKNAGELPVIPVDARAAEVRAIKMG
jgi:5'-nucleotidase